ncbi:hypothetical protein DH2020_049192 [Rehmannia glutinosa]|uniref:BHLH domain-containing protein n=1 Tax=Rehmannia glutinosa TaxID=99300 RepID=A0ABR0U3K6_REHGL
MATENFRKQLAVAVRSIQWSYAIFWSISANQSGALEWGDGYYNGDIKTRKTVQAFELNADQLGLQRSDQLRELYESLSLGETSPQPKRPTAALSPEDLTDAEWLPGRTLAKNETFWLRNAHRADTKAFSRSLLAKARLLRKFTDFPLLFNYISHGWLDLHCFLQSASIQTIVCFPHLGGAIELGTTELVPEDLNLIQHIKTSFLENPSSAVVTEIPNHGSNDITNNNDFVHEALDRANTPEKNLDRVLDCRDMDFCSLQNCPDDFADKLLRAESNFVDDIDGEASQMRNDNSMSSSDCVSQTHANHEAIVPFSDGNKANGVQGDDIRYQSVLSNLLKSSQQLILGPYFRNGNRESSFFSWNNRMSCCQSAQTVTPQRLLKKVLFEVARMHENCRIESGKQIGRNDDISKPEGDELDRNHVLSERKRREKMNERFMILGSLVPSGGKVDKVSILDHTIEYLKELERKVVELESYKEVMELESTTQSKPHDAIERTSDNIGPNKIDIIKKPLTNKRKACGTDKMAADNKRNRLRDSSTDSITISMTDKNVLIEIRCSWREFVLVEVMEVITKLHLDSQTVQSSNTDGILSVSIKAKCKGLKGASAGVIRQALQKVIRTS